MATDTVVKAINLSFSRRSWKLQLQQVAIIVNSLQCLQRPTLMHIHSRPNVPNLQLFAKVQFTCRETPVHCIDPTQVCFLHEETPHAVSESLWLSLHTQDNVSWIMHALCADSQRAGMREGDYRLFRSSLIDQV